VSQARDAAVLTCCTARSCNPSPAPEHANIEQAVAHEPIPAMDSTGSFASDIQPGDRRARVGADCHAAILVVQGGIDKDRLVGKIDAKSLELPDHGGELSGNGAWTVQEID
jgi:hypothetical protein